MIGIGAAIENMWIAANSLGLSAAFLGDVVIAEADVRSLLAFDGDLIGALALGYSTGVPDSPTDERAFERTERTVWH